MNKHTRSVSLIDGHTEEMTDAEIMKALNRADGLEHISVYCADNNGEDVCSIKLVDIIDLINRQQAEIELLQKTKQLIKSETIKEFAERLKAKRCGGTYPYVLVNVIDNLVKEMTEVSEDAKN